MVWLDDTGSGRTDPPSERVLSIENVAKMFGVSKLALRYYEFRGLIRRRHRWTVSRCIGWADCERLAFIIKCRKAGVKLSDIIAIIEATDDDVSPLSFRDRAGNLHGAGGAAGAAAQDDRRGACRTEPCLCVADHRLLGDTKPNSRD